jgi:signal transduction histidine kinase
MINQSKHSLNQFLNKRYLAILVLLIVLFSALILFMRYSVMDDTTDYYMHYDAQVLSEHYQTTDDIAEFDLGRKEYYWGVNNLPKRYRLLLEINNDQTNLILNETQAFQVTDKFVYILPYNAVDQTEVFFVLHLFDLNNEAKFYQSWQNAFILLISLLLFAVIFYSLYTNSQITGQMTSFSAWVKSMSHLEYNELKRQKMPTSLSFDELVNSANYLQSSLLTQYDLQHKAQILLTREKHFLSSLSHELRTPMAIMAAALTLLNKSEKIVDSDRGKLIKLYKAHQNMKQLTNTLLQLWRREEYSAKKSIQNELQNKVFLLDELVENSVSFYQEQFSKKNISFTVNIQGKTKLFSQLELADILISNLLRNACQYSANGQVNIDINNQCLFVENYILEDFTTEEKTKIPEESDITYGYGLGLLLAEKICQQQNWLLAITSKSQLFTVQVTFHDALD